MMSAYSGSTQRLREEDSAFEFSSGIHNKDLCRTNSQEDIGQVMPRLSDRWHSDLGCLVTKPAFSIATSVYWFPNANLYSCLSTGLRNKSNKGRTLTSSDRSVERGPATSRRGS